MLAAIISRKYATYSDIDRHLGMGDIWDLYELITVEEYNRRLANS